MKFVVPGQRYAEAVTSSGAAVPTAGRQVGAQLDAFAMSAVADTATRLLPVLLRLRKYLLLRLRTRVLLLR